MRSIISIIEPATSPDLVSLAAAKLELGITDDSQDDSLSAWITQASQIANNYCQTTLRAQTISETFRHSVGHHGDSFNSGGGYSRFFSMHYYSEGREMLVFGSAPVSNVASVTVDTVLLPEDQWENDDDRIFRLNTSGFPEVWRFHKSIVIVYTAGFDLNNVPADLQRAVLMILRDVRGIASREDPNLKSRETVGVSRLEWWVPAKSTTTLAPEITGLLDNYTRQWPWME